MNHSVSHVLKNLPSLGSFKLLLPIYYHHSHHHKNQQRLQTLVTYDLIYHLWHSGQHLPYAVVRSLTLYDVSSASVP